MLHTLSVAARLRDTGLVSGAWFWDTVSNPVRSLIGIYGRVGKARELSANRNPNSNRLGGIV